MKVLIVSTPVARIGDGLGGGVELTVENATKSLKERGHQVEVVAPAGSTLSGVSLLFAEGPLKSQAQLESVSSEEGLTSLDSAIQIIRAEASRFDVVLNFSFDRELYQLGLELKLPIAHFLTMGSQGDQLTSAIEATLLDRPGSVSVYTSAQARTFPFSSELKVLGFGVDLSQCPFGESSTGEVAWAGRISPEKGLEDALSACATLNCKLNVYGRAQDTNYFESLMAEFSSETFKFYGFLKKEEFREALSLAECFLITPKWEEALGIVAIESLACGAPVVAYRRGGLEEIVKHGVSGMLVEPGSVEGLVQGVVAARKLSREDCRTHAERKFSLREFGERLERWLEMVID